MKQTVDDLCGYVYCTILNAYASNMVACHILREALMFARSATMGTCQSLRVWNGRQVRPSRFFIVFCLIRGP